MGKFWRLACVVILALLLASCGGNKTGRINPPASTGAGIAGAGGGSPAATQSGNGAGATGEAKSKSLDAALSEIRGYTPPAKVDPEVFDKLRTALVTMLTQLDAQRRDGTAGRIVSSAPQGDAGKVTDLAYDPGTNTLSWSYVNLGDYDLNGEVGVSDITPIALHFGALTNDGIGDDALEAWIDGDKTGEVGVSDITPVALHYLNDVASYKVVTSATPTGTRTQIGSPVTFAGTTGFPRQLQATLPSGALAYVAVTPIGADAIEGTESNLCTVGDVAPIINSVSPISGDAGSQVTFAADVLGTEPITYSWDFGGGASPDTSSETSPQVTLSAAGTYNASISVSNSFGSDSINFELIVVPPNTPPLITSVTPQGGTEGVAATFVASVSGSNPITYSWSFGGGAIPNTSANASPQVMLGAAGVYSASLIATNAAGSDTYDFSLVVSGSGTPTVNSVSHLSGEAGNQVTYTADVGGTAPITYSWDFGGGAVPSESNEASPTVTFTSAGTYNANLTAANSQGSSSFDFVLSIASTPGPPTILLAGPEHVLTGKPVRMAVVVPGSAPTAYYWDFGLGASPSTSLEASPIITPGTPGDYPCSIQVFNDFGNESLDFTLHVELLPDIQSVTPGWVAPNQPATFTVNVNGTPPFTYSWNFGGASIPNTSVAASPTVMIGNGGAYGAVVVVSNQYGSDSYPFELGVGTVSINSVSPMEADSYSQVTFTASLLGTPPLSYSWDFGGGAIPNTSTSANPTVTLQQGKSYSCSLTVSNQFNSDELLFTLTVTPRWHITAIDSTGNVGLVSSLAIDSNDRPSICYYDSNNGDTKYAHYDGLVWQKNIVDSGAESCLALDSNDRPHISYADWTNLYILKYAHFDGSTWQTTVVDSSAFNGESSIFISSTNQPCISYYENETQDLNYAYYDGSSWQITTVDSPGDVGQCNSLVLDSSDRPHISYYDASQRYLKYAYHNGSSWQITTVDNTGDVGQSTSLALDSSNRPHIAYYDANNGHLKYAYHNGSIWKIETIDSATGVGQYTSLALNSSDTPSISYYDSNNGDLKYAFYIGPSWQIETVDSTGDVGTWSSLALDSSHTPCISYYDGTNGDLKYAWYR